MGCNIYLILCDSLLSSMQKYMRCKGTCLASIGPDQPAEVVDDAPEDLVCFCFSIKVSMFWGCVL